MPEAARVFQSILNNGPYDKIDSLLTLLSLEQGEIFSLILSQTLLMRDGTVRIPSFFRDTRGELSSYSEYAFWKTISLIREKPLWLYGVEHLSFTRSPSEEEFRLPGNLQYCTALRSLSFENCGLKSFPEEILDLRKLRNLDLSSNHIKSIPPGIGKFQQLVYFNAADNELKELPEQLGHLRKLKVLDLSGNCLSSIGFSLSSFHRLNSLDLSGNRLEAVPEGLQNLNQLEKVDLSFNELSAEEEAAWESGYYSMIKNYQWPLSF